MPIKATKRTAAKSRAVPLKQSRPTIARKPSRASVTVATYDLVAHLQRQRAFSLVTFGPGPRTAGVIAHIRKELAEIEASPTDVSEWIDVALLALDGAWRAGHSPEAIAKALEAKQAKNEARTWPDWRDAGEGEPIEHNRTEAPAEAAKVPTLPPADQLVADALASYVAAEADVDRMQKGVTVALEARTKAMRLESDAVGAYEASVSELAKAVQRAQTVLSQQRPGQLVQHGGQVFTVVNGVLRIYGAPTSL